MNKEYEVCEYVNKNFKKDLWIIIGKNKKYG